MPLKFNGTEIGTLKMGTTEINNAKMGSTDIYNNAIIIPKPSLASGTHIAAAFVNGKKIILQTASVNYQEQASSSDWIVHESHNPTYKNIITFNANNQSPTWVNKSSSVPINHRVSISIGGHIISFRNYISTYNSRYENGWYRYDQSTGIYAYNYDMYNESFKTKADYVLSVTTNMRSEKYMGEETFMRDYVVGWYVGPILYMFNAGHITGFVISSGYNYADNTFSSPSTTSIISDKEIASYTTDITRNHRDYGSTLTGYSNFNYCAKVLMSDSGSNGRFSKILIGGYSSSYLQGVLNAGDTNKFESTDIPLQRGTYKYYPKAAIRRIFPAEICQYSGYTYYGQFRKSGVLSTLYSFTGFEIFKPSNSDIDETTPILSVVFNNELVYFDQYTGDVYQWNKKRWLKNGTAIS